MAVTALVARLRDDRGRHLRGNRWSEQFLRSLGARRPCAPRTGLRRRRCDRVHEPEPDCGLAGDLPRCTPGHPVGRRGRRGAQHASPRRLEGLSVVFSIFAIAAGALLLVAPLWGATVLWMLMGISLMLLGVGEHRSRDLSRTPTALIVDGRADHTGSARPRPCRTGDDQSFTVAASSRMRVAMRIASSLVEHPSLR